MDAKYIYMYSKLYVYLQVPIVWLVGLVTLASAVSWHDYKTIRLARKIKMNMLKVVLK